MNRRLLAALALGVFVTAAGAPAIATAPAYAAQPGSVNLCKGSGGTPLNAKDKETAADADFVSCRPPGKSLAGNSGFFKNIVDTLIFLAGAIAVVVLIIGGIAYVTSTGDAARIKKAKDTILYAVIGLIVAILAYAIISYIIKSIG